MTDSLIAKAGIVLLDDANEGRFGGRRREEPDRDYFLKSIGSSLYHQYDVDNNGTIRPFLINLIDSPCQVDFSSEVSTALSTETLRVIDGALLVVDCIEGVSFQTDALLRQALQELVKPALVINKIDRALLEFEHNPEMIYNNFQQIIESVNVIISTYQKSDVMGDCKVYPDAGNVAFGSAMQGWGFTLNTFSRIYARKFKIEPYKLISKLWGDNFYDVTNKQWTTESRTEDGTTLTRAFCQLILEPIYKIASSIFDGKKEVYEPLIAKIGVELQEDDYLLSGKHLLRRVMRSWINGPEVLMEMIITCLPSPRTTQKYRTSYLYEGPMNDECAKSMTVCDPNGSLMMFISKIVPTSNKGKFYAFGRVFSGTVEVSKNVRIMGPSYKMGSDEDLFQKNIQKIILVMGRRPIEVPSVPCGNMCGLVGIDECLTKQGTISNSPQACTIRSMRYSISPVVKIAVDVKNPVDLPKLIEGLRNLSKSDPLIKVEIAEAEYIIAGCDEYHLNKCLDDLVYDYSNIEIVATDPVTTYKETVSEMSSQICLSESPNKYNRLFVVAQPLDEQVVIDIENCTIRPYSDPQLKARTLIETYSWDKYDLNNLWSFGPESKGPNLLVDQTKAVQYLYEVKNSIESAFQWVTKEGVLAEESMRGVRLNILDTVLHADIVHRGSRHSI